MWCTRGLERQLIERRLHFFTSRKKIDSRLNACFFPSQKTCDWMQRTCASPERRLNTCGQNTLSLWFCTARFLGWGRNRTLSAEWSWLSQAVLRHRFFQVVMTLYFYTCNICKILHLYWFGRLYDKWTLISISTRKANVGQSFCHL